MNLHLLALEASSSICDVAVLSCTDGIIRCYTVSHDATGEHAERLLPMIDQALEQAGLSRQDLGLVSFGQGPGGFTGLRVACGVAQGIAFGLGLSIVPVSSLLAVAVRAHRELGLESGAQAVQHIVAQDARMGEVYLGAYQYAGTGVDQEWQTLQEPILIDAEQVMPWLDQALAVWGSADVPVYLSGDALQVYTALSSPQGDMARLKLGGEWRADAATIAQLALSGWHRGDTYLPESVAPLYVRDKVAFTTLERMQGAGGNPRAHGFGVTLHPMTGDHLAMVAAIESCVQSFPWTHKNFSDGLAAGYTAWVASQHNQVIGFYMAMMAPDVAHILVIGVKPDHQGKGAGKQLLLHCEAQARLQGLDTIVLEVRVSNHQAIGFYRHLGFESFATRKDYYPLSNGKREDACIMKKTLTLPGVLP